MMNGHAVRAARQGDGAVDTMLSSPLGKSSAPMNGGDTATQRARMDRMGDGAVDTMLSSSKSVAKMGKSN